MVRKTVWSGRSSGEAVRRAGRGANAPLAFSWAWKTALELSASDLSAERCAEVITKRYQDWQTWLAGADNRAQARRNAAGAIDEQIKALKESRWWCALTGFAVGVVVVAVALY